MDCRLPPRDAWDARCASSLVRSVRALELRLSFYGALRAVGDSGYEFEGIVGQHNRPSILLTVA